MSPFPKSKAPWRTVGRSAAALWQHSSSRWAEAPRRLAPARCSTPRHVLLSRAMPPKRAITPTKVDGDRDPCKEPEPEAQLPEHESFRAAKKMGGLEKAVNKVFIPILMATVRIIDPHASRRAAARCLRARQRDLLCAVPPRRCLCNTVHRRLLLLQQVMAALAVPAIVWGIPMLPLWVFGRPFGVWLTAWYAPLPRASLAPQPALPALNSPRSFLRRCKKSHPCIVNIVYHMFGTKVIMYGADPKAEPIYMVDL